MTTNAGVIKYEVEAGTAGILNAEKIVNKSTNAIVNDLKRVEVAERKQTEVSKSVTKSFQLQKGASQQLGFQLQDMAVQAQMGISAFTILGQQGSQLAGVFGPGGALVGAAIAVASAIGGVMYAALSKTEKKIEDVTYKTENYKEKLDSLTFAQAQASIVKFRDENKQLSDQLQVAGNVVERLTNQSRYLSLQLNDEGKFTGKSAKESEKKYKQLQKDQTQAKADYDTISQKIKENEAAVKTLVEAQDRYRLGLQNTGTETRRNTTEITNMIEALKIQAATIGMTEKETALYVATLMKATDAEKAAISKHYDTINVYESEQQAIRDTMASLDEFAAFEAEQANKRASLKQRVSSIGLTPIEEIRAQFARETELLIEAEERGIAIKGEYSERYKQLKLEESAAIEALNKKQEQSTVKSFNALENSASSALGSVIVGARTGKEALADFSQSILTHVIGALIKMAIQAAIGQATVQATTTASAAAMSASLATPAALMSLATAGANSAPASAGIASTVALSNGLAVAGGREFGGPVSAGSMYRVGERGPEILTSGGRNYMIPGESGQVTNNGGSFGGGDVSVIVNNNAANTQATASQSADGKTIEVTINEINRQVREGRGSFVSNLKQNTNLQFRAGR